jgi:hypothetical protein
VGFREEPLEPRKLLLPPHEPRPEDAMASSLRRTQRERSTRGGLKRFEESIRGRGSASRVLLEEARHEVGEGRRHVAPEAREGKRLLRQVGPDDLGRGIPEKGGAPGHDLVEGAAEGVEIRSGVGGVSPHRFGGEIGDGSADRRFVSPIAHPSGEPEVHELGVARAVPVEDEDVRRLDVAMDEAAGVEIREGVSDLGEDLEDARPVDLAPPEVPVEAFPLDELHREVGDRGSVFRRDPPEVVDFGEVGVGERGQGPELLLEVAERGLRVTGREEDLERELSFLAELEDAVDDAHPAAPDLRETAEAPSDDLRNHVRLHIAGWCNLQRSVQTGAVETARWERRAGEKKPLETAKPGSVGHPPSDPGIPLVGSGASFFSHPGN